MSEPEFLHTSDIWKILGRRWTVDILEKLNAEEAPRFNELKRSLTISSTMLSERLLELENEGLVEKKIYHSIRPRSEYRLTAKAKELLIIVSDVRVWCIGWNSADKGHQLAIPYPLNLNKVRRAL